LDAGVRSTWPERRGLRDVSAVQSALHEYFKNEDFFFCELQQTPRSFDSSQYDIHPGLVRSRTNGLPRLALPAGVIAPVAHTDINFSGLHWTAMGVCAGAGGSVVAYGKIPEQGNLVEKNASATERRQRIAWGLSEWWNLLCSLRIPFRALGIDGGYEAETVRDWILAKRQGALFQTRGFASQKYRPDKQALTRYDHAHLTESAIAGRFIAFDSDFYRETVQRGFLVEPGAPGAISLYGDETTNHRAYSEQICGETLADKTAFADGTKVYRWTHKPGDHWDWLDSLAGCLVCASAMGIVAGAVVLPKVGPRRETRKAKVQIV
jgi:hypothetical protein